MGKINAQSGPAVVSLHIAGSDAPLELENIGERLIAKVPKGQAVEVWLSTLRTAKKASCSVYVDGKLYPGNPVTLNLIPVCISTIYLVGKILQVVPNGSSGATIVLTCIEDQSTCDTSSQPDYLLSTSADRRDTLGAYADPARRHTMRHRPRQFQSSFVS